MLIVQYCALLLLNALIHMNISLLSEQASGKIYTVLFCLLQCEAEEDK